MKLEEIESAIAALRKRYGELDEKLVPKRDGVVDGDISSAMNAVDRELSRLANLRETALVADLIVDDTAEPRHPRVQSSSPPSHRALPRDFDHDPDADVNPLDGLKRLPDDENELSEIHRRLLHFCLQRVTDLVKSTKAAIKHVQPVVYSQAQHSASLTALAYVMMQARMIGAMGRDRRNEVEARLLARIEALEARPSLKYAGVWDQDTQFNEGDVVTDQGSAWHCNRSTRSRPPSSDWVLMVKKGRDAR